ncbi:MAG: hypothetical protein ACOH5I_04155 [Oligoflexus sp.]
MKSTGRRRGFVSWFVEPYRQVKLWLMFLFLNLTFAGLIFLVFGYYLWDVYQAMAAYFQFTDQQNLEVLTKFQIPALIGAGLLLVFVALSIMVSVRYTHRIYGPLVSIHRFLDDLLANQPVSPLLLRESDQLKELAEKLNQLAEKAERQRNDSSKRPKEGESAS